MTKRNSNAERLADWLEWFEDARKFPNIEAWRRNEWRNDFAAKPTRSLSEAAEFFGLDPAKAVDSAVLLRVLADVVFGTRKKGRHTGTSRWNDVRLFQLGVHLQAVEKDRPGISNKKAAAEIKRRYRQQYKTDEPETIRQRLRDARLVFDWSRNWDTKKGIKTEMAIKEHLRYLAIRSDSMGGISRLFIPPGA
jgi:hypothetical protein